MPWARRNTIAVILLLCAALLSTRTLGDHLHFCFDGQEPLVSLHGVDGEMHHLQVSGSKGHNDRDYDLIPATAKSQLQDVRDALPTLFLVASIFALLVPHLQVRWMRTAAVFRPTVSFRFIRPPLRGPPR
jgi:hypothetical protein